LNNLNRSLLEIVEIYSDATKSDKITIVATIYNIGMIEEFFKVKLINCSIDTKKDWTEIHSLEAHILPFHRYNYNYTLNLYGPFAKSDINCTCKIVVNYVI